MLSRNRGLVAQLLALIVAVCAVPVLVGAPPYEAGFTHGFFLAAGFGALVFGFTFHGDGAYLLAGNLGEDATIEELVAAKKAGRIWSAVNNVEARGRDVDHVVLSPSGVLALESKFRFKGADARWLAWATAQAHQAARTARLVLQSKDVAYRTEVRPVLVVWGGARRELPTHQIVNEVDVVRGDALLEWLHGCSRGRLAQDRAEALTDRLAAFADSRRPVS